jgi:hypothetical protein
MTRLIHRPAKDNSNLFFQSRLYQCYNWRIGAKAANNLCEGLWAMANNDEEGVLELNERRLHLKIFDHWVSLLGGREFPELGEMQSEMEDDTLATSFVIDLKPGLADATLHFAGRELLTDYGGDRGLSGIKIADLGKYSVIARLADHYLEVISNRAPIGFEAEFERQNGRQAAYRGILLPFSEDGSDINYILGVTSWVDKDSIH